MALMLGLRGGDCHSGATSSRSRLENSTIWPRAVPPSQHLCLSPDDLDDACTAEDDEGDGDQQGL